MIEGCKKTYSDLYLEKWDRDLDRLTSLSTGLSDKIVFGLQTVLATSEILSESAVAEFLAVLAPELAATTAGVAAAIGSAADLMLSGVSASTVVSNVAGEAMRRLLLSAGNAIIRTVGAEAAAPLVAAFAEVAVPELR